MLTPIDGHKIAAEVLEKLKKLPKPQTFFGAALVGNDPASEGFLKQKAKVATALGLDFRLYKLPEDTSTDALRKEIGRLSKVKKCGAFIVQLPLPEGINKHYVLNAIPKEKDVDMLSETALGAFYTGRSPVKPPAVSAVEEILRPHKRNLRECAVTLMGLGFLTGKPIGFWLQGQVAELTILDEHSQNVRRKLKEADIVISGAGAPNLFGPEDLKENALVIDFGWNKTAGKIAGDFAVPAEARNQNIFYTPTPGGTGPIVVSKLFENFYTLTRE